MKKNENNEPRDEFDSVMLPAFLAKPLGFLQGTSGQTGVSGFPEDVDARERTAGSPAGPTQPDPYDPASYTEPSSHTDPAHSATSGTSPGSRWGDPDEDATASGQQQPPAKWWAGARGRTLIYIVGAVFWVFIQSRN